MLGVSQRLAPSRPQARGPPRQGVGRHGAGPPLRRGSRVASRPGTLVHPSAGVAEDRRAPLPAGLRETPDARLAWRGLARCGCFRETGSPPSRGARHLLTPVLLSMLLAGACGGQPPPFWSVPILVRPRCLQAGCQMSAASPFIPVLLKKKARKGFAVFPPDEPRSDGLPAL